MPWYKCPGVATLLNPAILFVSLANHLDATPHRRAVPILTDHSQPGDWIDPDLVPRPVVTYGTAGIDVANLNDDGRDHMEKDFHSHRKGQLMMLLRGVLSCEVQGGLWIVPPQSAVWVPGEVQHKIAAAGIVEVYVAFIDRAFSSTLPSRCCVLCATPLLRELIIGSAGLAVLYPEGGRASHLNTLLLDELAAAPVGALHLPMPVDARLRKLADALIEDPAERGTLQSWASRVGLSERTLARRLMQETGLSFGRWRRQLHCMLAVKWLSTGLTVQQVASDLGYESAGSFVTMFRKVLGTSPARYVAQRRHSGR